MSIILATNFHPLDDEFMLYTLQLETNSQRLSYGEKLFMVNFILYAQRTLSCVLENPLTLFGSTGKLLVVQENRL